MPLMCGTNVIGRKLKLSFEWVKLTLKDVFVVTFTSQGISEYVKQRETQVVSYI